MKERPIKQLIQNLPKTTEPFDSHCTSGMLKSDALKISVMDTVILNMETNRGKVTYKAFIRHPHMYQL
jgi:hypothetical protein